MSRSSKQLLWLVLAPLMLASPAFAQYSITWYTIDGGGGTSSGGTYTLSGTIGQPDAGAPMVGGTFTLTGGYWAGAGETPNPCPGDYTNDGGVDGDDVIAFFADWDMGSIAADVNHDEGVDGDDVIFFFEHWDAGC